MWGGVEGDTVRLGGNVRGELVCVQDLKARCSQGSRWLWVDWGCPQSALSPRGGAVKFGRWHTACSQVEMFDFGVSTTLG